MLSREKSNFAKNTSRGSTIIRRGDNLVGGEEIEIAAQVSIPLDGGWGWVVVASGVLTMAVVDGVAYTFGSIIHDVSRDFNISISLASIVNSITVSMYFVSGPLVAAFINRYGFRACAMSGSVCTSFCLFISYFISNFALLCLFYGVISGFGLCLMQMSTTLVVGFYFEKLRSLTLSMTSSGASMGVMILSPFNAFITGKCGWRTVAILESGLCGVVYFVTMTYRPLLSFSVVNKHDLTLSRTVTYLPSLSGVKVSSSDDIDRDYILQASRSERIFKAVSSQNFPSAAQFVNEIAASDESLDDIPGPSTSKFKLISHNPIGGITERQVQELKSIMTKRASVDTKRKKHKDIDVEIKAQSKEPKGCCGRLCHWYGHINETRPLYRDDVFYEGDLKRLPIYQKSALGMSEEDVTGLEYQLAVTRAVAADDLREKKGVFTTAARRVLSSMLDTTLLKRKSFLLVACSSFVVYLGFLVPYIYIQDRAKTNGIDPALTNFLVSTISLSNLIGRLIWGSLACKYDPIRMYILCNFGAGLSIIGSNLYFNVYFQFAMCLTFGFFGAATSTFRGIQVVHLYGLEKLTNGMGIVLLFSGMGTLLGPTIASSLKTVFDSYNAAFYFAGTFIITAGLILVPVQRLTKKEDLKAALLKEHIEALRAKRIIKKETMSIKETPLEEGDENDESDDI